MDLSVSSGCTHGAPNRHPFGIRTDGVMELGPVAQSPALLSSRRMKPRFFKTPSDFRTWLDAHHATEQELLVGFYKRESVDEALALGWSDGVRKRIDEVSYTIRFTPRKATSNWSAINIRRVEEL